MTFQPETASNFPVRADLHCHSNASSEAGEAVLNAINCPESFSQPSQVYAQAKRRGMDFATITDHDSIDGVVTLARPDVLIGEELTCYFPEDRCKMHVLVWGIGRREHNALQAVAGDLYAVAEYIEQHQIAHAVAHPVYRQNDRLENWHIERLLLLFKGFECLNGAHSLLHREAFEPLVTGLTPQRIATLASHHELKPRWPEPWRKARTGGSDDHGLFNIGRTWTEFPPDVNTVDKVLDAIRTGRCRPGGEAGSSLKLAHNFYSVGIRYCKSRMSKKPTASMKVLEALIGERPLRKRDIVKAAVKGSMTAVGRRLGRKLRGKQDLGGTALLNKLFRASLRHRIASHTPLLHALRTGQAPLAEHEAVFKLLGEVTRDTTAGVAESIVRGLTEGKIAPVFDAVSSIACQQFMLMPYYFAMFHQNRERHLLPRVTGNARRFEKEKLKLGIFSDTFDEGNEISRFVRLIGREGARRGRSCMVHTCTSDATEGDAYRKNFEPLTSIPLPGHSPVQLAIPPIAEILEWADREQFDAIHVHTPGPMGLCGRMVGAMLRIPVLATYHTDFASHVMEQTADHRLTVAAESYISWFFGNCDSVFAKARHFEHSLIEMGISRKKSIVLPPCVDSDIFSPIHRDPHYWHDRKIHASHHLLYFANANSPRDLEFLSETCRRIHENCKDVALIVAGESAAIRTQASRLTGMQAHFVGRPDERDLAQLYANSDLLLLPSGSENTGQAILEAQASGLPVIVSSQGASQEVMDDGLTGVVVGHNDAAGWASAIVGLLTDESKRMRMSRTARQRVARFGAGRAFDVYWDQHVQAAIAAAERHAAGAAPPPQASGHGNRLTAAFQEVGI